MPSTFCVSRPPVSRNQEMIIGVSPDVGNSTNGSDGETITIIARRCGGCVSAVSQQVRPPYEPPIAHTSPSDHGCSAIHSIVSNPSAPSLTYGVNRPSESPRPRTSWTTTAYPRAFQGSTTFVTRGMVLL